MAAKRERRLTWMAKTIPELSLAVGISERQLGTYIARGLPRGPEGFSIAECVLWLRDNVWLRQAGPSGDLDERKQLAEVRKLEEQAAMAGLRRRKLAGELMPTAEVLAYMTAQAAVVRSRMQATPGELSPMLPPEVRDDVRLDLENRIALTLTDLSQTPLPKEFPRVLALAKAAVEAELAKKRTVKKPKGKK